ncbi:MAG TPA: tetratricopeptide repeat protein [Candidatus Thermoplasmatota archaeon]
MAGGAAGASDAVERGLALLDRGSLEGAVEQFEAATNLDLNCLEAYGWLATALARLGRFDDAHRNADHALWLDPLSAWAWNRKGTVFFEMREWPMALRCFRKAVELEPAFAAAAENVRRTEALAGVNAGVVDGKRGE